MPAAADAAALHKAPAPPLRIGLCLSGGGFRAAAFHLGVLSYLDQAGLLSRVNMLSTVSGGTITGVGYVVSLLEGQSFGEHFRSAYERLERVGLFKLALERLSRDSAHTIPSKRRNLITSMADVYSRELFFNRKQGRPYLLGDVLDGATGPLSEITFNATDFRAGLAFRFQKSQAGLIGNRFCRLDRDEAKAIRLGDIVAASSCFPGGFEPMQFPDDFAWPGGQVPAGVSRAMPPAGSIALMDGGVYDNQGIDSLLLADRRNDARQEEVAEAAKNLDLFIISDTNQREDTLYPFPSFAEQPPNVLLRPLLWWNPSLAALNWLAWCVQVLCLLTVVAVIVAFCRSEPTFDVKGVLIATFAYGIPVLLAAFTSGVLFVVRKQLRVAVMPLLERVHPAGWNDIKQLRLVQLIEMIGLRVGSLVAMTSAVFMKRIRQLGYRFIYESPRYDGKRVSNFVYHLLASSSFEKSTVGSRREALAPPLQHAVDSECRKVSDPSRQLQDIAHAAHAMPTTLWFVDAHELPSLAAAGQATMCWNLMRWIVRTHLESGSQTAFPGELAGLWDRLVADWNTLNSDPHTLLKRDLNRSSLPPPPPRKQPEA